MQSDPFQLPPGVSEVRLRGELPAGTNAAIQVEARNEGGEWIDLGQAELSGPPARGLRTWREWFLRDIDTHLFWLAIALYLAVRLIALPNFPAYFFSDEAIQTVLAADLVRDGMHGYSGELFPSYFPNGGQYNLGVSVYAQVIPYLLFGKSIWVTRGTSVLISLLAVICAGLALRDALRIRRAWLIVLILSATPAWFLHTRTAFETSLAVSFYAVFLSAYLLYRKGKTKWIYAAVVAAALCFYSYSPAQIVVVVSGLLLFFSDLRYHWRQRFTLLPALGLALLMTVPYIRHQVLHPDSILRHLAILDFDWTSPIPLSEKLTRAAGIYLRGLDPVYWFLPNVQDLARHTMAGWGHLVRWTFPFFLGGLGLALWKFRQSEYRSILLALLACPLGAVLVDLGVTRVLFYVIPAAMLTAIGFDAAIEFLGRRRGWLRPIGAGASLAALALVSLFLLRFTLIEGPRAYSDYGLGGIQYGAPLVFHTIQDELKAHPDQLIVLSPTWANGTDILARYFLGDPRPISINSIRTYTEKFTPFPEQTLFILPPDEYESLPRAMFKTVEVEKILPYPDGRPGFYFLRLAYAPDAEQKLIERLEQQAAPVEEAVQVGGATVNSTHTRLDIGQIVHAFDGDPETLIRTASANPLVIELAFPEAVQMSGLAARVGGVPTQVRVQAVVEGESQARKWELTLAEDPLPRDAQVDFGAELPVRNLRVEVLNTLDSPEAHVHLWEIWLR